MALAEEKIATRQWEAAISQLTSATQSDPANAVAQALLTQLTAATVRPAATFAIPFGMPVEHLAVSGNSLFVSLAGERNTLVRWNIPQRKIESILFPTVGEHTRSLTLSPDGRFLVIERGGVTLLCHADTLKPIADIGYLPENFTPSAAIVFSADGLLLAHPTLSKEKEVIWQILDSSSGEVLRSSFPITDSLAARLDRQVLRILLKDGSSHIMPISPIEEIHTEGSKGTAYSAAQFLPDGSLMAFTDQGPHETPATIGSWDNLLTNYPWSHRPSLWTDLLWASPVPISVKANSLTFQDRKALPIRTSSSITAVVQSGEFIITGEENGRVTLHGFIPLKDAAPKTAEADTATLSNLTNRLEISKITSAPSPSKVLADCLAQENPDVLQLCLATARNLPPLLERLAKSRIAWLQGHHTEALQNWAENFPDLKTIRQREDWEGWEQADFTPAFEQMRALFEAERAALEIPADASPEQIQATAQYLLDPATLPKVGRRRLADAALKAALSLATAEQQGTTAIKLATLARNLGAAPEPTLRAEALAFSALGNYQKSHPLWISLITDFPVSNQASTDYAEASQAAWQMDQPEQAQQILITGIHHFPQDGNLAFRVGWMSLMSNNPLRATEFLLTALKTGLIPVEQEQALAMLAIASRSNGAPAAASRYFRELKALNPSWMGAETIKALNWPEEWKKILLQLAK